MPEKHFLKAAAEMLNVPLDNVKEWSIEDQEKIYASAYAFYETGYYEKGSDFFTQLILSNPYAEKYWRGLAACRQMEKKYLDSLHAWCLVALLNEHDPSPHFHAAECLLSLQDKEEALKALSEAEERVKKDGNFSHLRDKIDLLKQIHLKE
ncbi:MAG TPA: SycD/LcrH family type III secretion system chaperone [Rhabdochlamydiaceae bacterium]|nr:SycD/LcrH family type III secretion system chaperone [Rhabdochlamydiaceae bacterium]